MFTKNSGRDVGHPPARHTTGSWGSSQNRIGGPAPGQRNVIARGISIEGANATSSQNVIQGNLNGTDATGRHRIADPQIFINDSARNRVLGNTSVGDLIIRNDRTPPVSTGNVVQGNHFGTDITGNVALVRGAGFAGVSLPSGIRARGLRRSRSHWIGPRRRPSRLTSRPPTGRHPAPRRRAATTSPDRTR